MNSVHLLLITILLQAACSNQSRNQFSKATISGSEKSSKSELNQLLESEVITRDENGEILEIKGLVYSQKVDKYTNGKGSKEERETVGDDIKEIHDSEDKVFEFESPEGSSAEFSEPIMISGAFLNLTENQEANGCTWVDYKDDEPREGELIDVAAEKNLCGVIDVSFCIKFSSDFAAGYEPNIDDHIYIETPAFQLHLPCSDYAFNQSSIEIVEQESQEVKPSEIEINIQTLSSVFEIYLTDTPGCSSGGDWQTIESDTVKWPLNWEGDKATVYAKFRDVFGKESACTFQTIAESSWDWDKSDNGSSDVTPPQSTRLSINNDEIYTSSVIVSLSLNAIDAAEMYISNTAGCIADGVWESYANSKAWTLAQTNTTSTVYVKYRDTAGNESSCIDDTIIHDDLAPTATSISINAGAAATNVTAVTLSLAATDASEMYVSNTAGCSAGGIWEAYSTSKAWTLGQTNGTATVYIKFRDVAGNESSCIDDTITHDNSIPTATSISIDAGASYAMSATVNLSLGASGATEMYITNTSGCSAGGIWESYSTSKAWTLGQTITTASVFVKYRAASGSESSCISDTIIHDDTAPSSTSISVSGGSIYTTSTNVSLTLSASDASEMYISNTATCSVGGSWETYSTTKAWTLGQTNGTATVYVKFRDVAGNESSCINDTITHDDTAPTGASVSIDSGASYATSSGVSLTFAATGASEMYVTNTAGCSAGGIWEAYSTSKAWTLGQTNATATVYIKYRDVAGNESGCINDTIIHDSIAPSAPALTISSSEYTASSSNTLFPSASGASEMYITNTAGCGSGGIWESYATTRTNWSLGSTNALTNVYVKYRDDAGNESTCVSDSITHDNGAPSTPASVNDGVNTTSQTDSPSLSWAASTDTVTSVDYYEVSIGTSAGGTNVKTWTNVGNVTSTSFNDLSLNFTDTYYVNVRAVDIVGNTGSHSSGDGFVRIPVVTYLESG